MTDKMKPAPVLSKLATKVLGRIVLDYPLDVLLDRSCRLDDYERGADYRYPRLPATVGPRWFSANLASNLRACADDTTRNLGALRFPSKATTGTGNILIVGRPGTGKSTLSLQCAVACTYSPNNYCSLYISLEESPEQVRQKCIQSWMGERSWGPDSRTPLLRGRGRGSLTGCHGDGSIWAVTRNPRTCPLTRRPEEDTRRECNVRRS